MAEVVGLLASISTLIETTTTVIAYVDAVKKAPPERAGFARQATGLLKLLTDLKYDIEEAKSHTGPWFTGLLGLQACGGALDQLRGHMERLAQKLEPSTGKVERIGKALIWPLERRDIEQTLAQVEHVKSLITIALQRDEFKLSLSIKQDLVDVKKDLKDKQEDEDSKKIFSWLSSLDFASKHIDFRSRRQTGTGDWLFSDSRFQNWQQGGERILWCPGIPGAGKTILASMVIDWLADHYHNTDVAILYLYCSYKDAAAQTPLNMIGDLLKQIAQHKSAITADIRQLYDRYTQQNTRPKMQEITSLLTTEMKCFSRTFIVIDALDECPERDDTRGVLLAEILALSGDARILITSRYSQKIEEKFKNVPHIDILATDEDITRYVTSRIQKERSLARLVSSNQALMEEAIKTVVEKSQGMFLLAQLHVDSLAKCLNRRQVRSGLAELPKKLDETYDQAMERIQKQDENEVKLAHLVLLWIAYSLRPLTVAELQHALAVEPGDDDLDDDGLYEVEFMVSVCAGLVTVDEESDHIRLVHYTTQAYIERIREAQFPGAPSIIAKTCLTYLTFRPFSEDLFTDQEEELDNRLNKYPFLHYTSTYWGTHLGTGIDDDARTLASGFLDNYIALSNTVHVAGLDYFTEYRKVPCLTRLHFVAWFGLVDFGLDLLNNGADVNAEDHLKMTPLSVAVYAGHTEMVQALLERGANAKVEDSNQMTPMLLAAHRGHDLMIQLLIDAGVDCNKWSGASPLYYAIETNRVGVVRILIENGADLNLSGNSSFGWQSSLPIEQAARLGFEDIILLLLEKGGDISEDPIYVGNALHEAAFGGHIRVVELLISRGINISKRDAYRRTALHRAVQNGNSDIVRLLLEKKIMASAMDASGLTAFHIAAQEGKAEILQILLYDDTSILKTSESRRSLVQEALNGQSESVSSVLLEYINDTPEADLLLARIRYMRLRCAVNQSDKVTAESLLRSGVDPDSPRSLLFLALSREQPEIVKLLLAHGADVSAKTWQGRTPLHWAVHKGYSEGAQILLEQGADVHAADDAGETPLCMVAGGRGDVSLMQQLLKYSTREGEEDIQGFRIVSSILYGDPQWFYYERNPEYSSRFDEPPYGRETEDEETILTRRLTLLDFMIETGVNINACVPDSICLVLAGPFYSSKLTLALVQRLLEIGADVAVSSKDGESALFLAACHEDPPEIVRLLLDHKADVDQLNLKPTMEVPDRTALNASIQGKSKTTANILLKAGADVTITDADMFSALLLAIKGSWAAGASLLLDHGADINTRHFEEKITALHYAVKTKSPPMVLFLLRRGADISAKD